MRTRKIQQNKIKFVQPCEEKSFSVFFFNCIWFVFSVSVCNFIAYFRKSKKNFWFKTLAVAIFGYKYCGKFYLQYFCNQFCFLSIPIFSWKHQWMHPSITSILPQCWNSNFPSSIVGKLALKRIAKRLKCCSMSVLLVNFNSSVFCFQIKIS